MMGQNHHQRKETAMKSDGRYCQFKIGTIDACKKKVCETTRLRIQLGINY